MRHRKFPIGLVGLLILLLSFIGWYSYTTSPLAQHDEESPVQNANNQNTPAQVDSADEIKKTLAINQAKIKEEQSAKSSAVKPVELNTGPTQADKKPPTPPKSPNVNADPKNNVVDYWWLESPPKKK